MKNRAAAQDTIVDVLYLRHGRWIASRARRQFGVGDAEDLVQDTWLKLITAQNVGVIRHPRSFLMKVLSNVAATRFRTSKRPALQQDPSESADVGAQEQAVLARQVILSLPQPLRDVFVMSRFGGLTNAQIAEQLGISPKTVEWRMTKALAHCAAQLRA